MIFSTHQIVITAIVLLIVVLMFGFRAIPRRHQEMDFDKLMGAHAEDAVKRANADFSIQLDYSPGSIAQVEKILEAIYESYQQNPVDENTLGRESRLWGCYIGEVIKKTHGGTWKIDSAVAGQGALPLVWGPQNEMYPCAWVYKRLTNGEEDNVEYKYKVLIIERDKNNSSPNSLVQSEVIEDE